MTARLAGRVRVVGSRVRRWGEEGMTTAEYAVGTMAAVAFAALLLTAVVVEIRLWLRAGRTPETEPRTDLRWGAAALGTILLAFAIWNITKSLWCDPHSLLQGHAAWHLLDAASAYLLFRLWASERSEEPVAR